MVNMVFFGSDTFSCPCLRRVSEEFQVKLVVTRPPKKAGRGKRVRKTPVEELAEELSIPVTHFKDTKKIREELLALKPDFIVLAAFGGVLKKDILEIPKVAPLNLHPSLLPELRGASPVNWAILRGLERTGVTIMVMDEGLDTGPIVLQEEVPIEKNWDSHILSNKLAEIGAELMVEAIRGMLKGNLKPEPQKGEPTYAPPLRKEMGLLDWRLPSESLERRVKGLKPWPMAYTFLKGKRVIITEARGAPSSKDGEPGVVLSVGELIEVKAGEGSLFIERLKPEGKREMHAKEFLAGRNVVVGDRFSPAEDLTPS